MINKKRNDSERLITAFYSNNTYNITLMRVLPLCHALTVPPLLAALLLAA